VGSLAYPPAGVNVAGGLRFALVLAEYKRPSERPTYIRGVCAITTQTETEDPPALYSACTLTAPEVAALTGLYVVPDTSEWASARRDALATHARLRREIAGLRAKGKR
jgi:hypothetical protein